METIMQVKEKLRAQVKSKFYYLFWGIATLSVVAGQTYVGSAYRDYARSLNRIFDEIELELRNYPTAPRFY